MVENCKKSLNKIEELKPYLVEFNKNSTIKDKMYPYNYTVEGEDCQLIIIIDYNVYIFLANNGMCKVWIRVEDTFLHFKSWG